MNIKSPRLTITDLTMEMCADMHKNSLDDDNRRFVPDEVYETMEDTHKIINWLITSSQSPDGPFVYPVLLHNNANIGYVQACKVEEGWEIGYHIAKTHTGNGYATEAVKAFLPVIMPALHTDRIYGIVLEENTASHRVLEKCGFQLAYQGIGSYQQEERNLRKYIFKI